MEHSPSPSVVSDAFARRFRERAGPAGVLSFAEFMGLALYDDEVGYYRRERRRVAREAGTDFYTATSFGTVFGQLVAAASTTLLGGAGAAHDYDFIEIGAEPERGVLEGVEHGFRTVRALHVGEPLELRGRAVVFSNELFDAQPFHRVRFRDGVWREAGVDLRDDGLAWTELDAVSEPVAAIRAQLPARAPEGYVLDLPLAAARLAREIVAQPWQGLFLAIDYGRTWRQLASEFPAGTGRAYARHRQSDDLLAQPGEHDLTCHVCWDWLEGELRSAGFAPGRRESQEAFFVRRATATVEALVAADPDPLSLQRTQLKHLLHPALMGQRFEALWGLRLASPSSPPDGDRNRVN